MDQSQEQPPAWPGPHLALEELKSLMYQIRNAVQPERADIIARATGQSLKIIDQLEVFIASQPPGTFSGPPQPAPEPAPEKKHRHER